MVSCYSPKGQVFFFFFNSFMTLAQPLLKNIVYPQLHISSIYLL